MFVLNIILVFKIILLILKFLILLALIIGRGYNQLQRLVNAGGYVSPNRVQVQTFPCEFAIFSTI